YEHGGIRVIDRLRETVRLALGLSEDGALDPDRHRTALSCLSQFGQRLRELDGRRVRAVATNTVRRMKNPRAFLLTAETALGHPIEVVSGREEGRLIYLGVAHGIPESRERRLVIDIGGGSTEFIIGRGLEALETESLQMGCVATTLRFFRDGKCTRRRWERARSEIAVEFQQFAAEYRARGWSEAVGSSGTVRALGAIGAALGHGELLTAAALGEIRDRIVAAREIAKIKLPTLSEDRRAVIAGGALVLDAAFAEFGIREMRVAETAMREGLLYDMLGRAEHRDPREESIDGLAQRYAIDVAQARRVEATALALFAQLAKAWKLGDADRERLVFSARVHEIGLAIAHSQHHVHGAYVVANSDLFGFTRQEQQVLAFIVRAQRRGVPAAELAALPARQAETALKLAVLLRLAALFHRGRGGEVLPKLRAQAAGSTLKLTLPKRWLAAHPLTRTDLDTERGHLAAVDLRLLVATT
ncbi:MAG TPA: Ppx/GppA phosphatase family protein, partial [Xanthomonadales bacterium]|nr:Ppx/GppA phosphatase family protein [Xanthomonadales bacterium]